jgi:Flp pilus assembly protein TadG
MAQGSRRVTDILHVVLAQRSGTTSRLSRAQRGSHVVEAALALPLVLAVILGSIELGLLGHANLNLGAAVPEAAREASIARSASDADLRVHAVLRSRIGSGSVAGVRRVVI